MPKDAGVLAWARAHRGAAAAIVIAAAITITLGIYWFAPQRLVLDRTVAEPPPVVVPSSTLTPREPPRGAQDAAEAEGDDPTALRSLEHETTGRVAIVELQDGSRFVRLEDLDTSDGPDLRVYLTDQPVSDDWHVWDDGRYVDLGPLKGNVGDSNYRIPDGIDLDQFETVVIWCRRFTVGFAVAPLA